MIPDLIYIPNYISRSEETKLIALIDAQIWQNPFKRRVQHYGYIYDYKNRKVTEELFIGILPAWLDSLASRFRQNAYIEDKPEQVIINEYIPGQGIAPHVDCEPCFGDTILSLSLGSSCVMDFLHLHSNRVHQQVLERRSLVIMKKEARYEWQHGIRGRKTDKIEGVTVKRERRLSLTFRKVILNHSK